MGFPRTSLADRLVTTRKPERVRCQLVADGTSQLERNVVLGQSAKHWLVFDAVPQ